jgi:DNA-binding response OmpR family regulator
MKTMFQRRAIPWPVIDSGSGPARYPEVGDDAMSSSASQTTGPRILVVDDEDAILDFVELGLKYEGFEVELARDGVEAISAVASRRPDLILLDLSLPGLDGLDVCRRVRQASDVPIIMLTARGDVDERVEGLEAGADDYLPKPFKFKELLARVRAVLRRRTSAAERILKFGGLELNRDTREVFQEGRPVHLTPRELDLLETFMLHPRQVMTRDVLLDRVWGTDYLGDGNLIEVHISALREKLSDNDRRLIRTVRGVGYALSGATLT